MMLAINPIKGRSTVRLMTALGVLGLAPFIVPLVLRFEGGEARLSSASLQAIYAAVILAFLGGVRAAQAAFSPLPDARALTLSMIPPLVGFALAAATFAGQSSPVQSALCLLGLALALAVQGAWDISAPDLPDWYRKLRAPLTLAACPALAAGAVLARLAT